MAIKLKLISFYLTSLHKHQRPAASLKKRELGYYTRKPWMINILLTFRCEENALSRSLAFFVLTTVVCIPYSNQFQHFQEILLLEGSTLQHFIT